MQPLTCRSMRSDVVQLVDVGVALHELFGERDRARIGERAEVAPGAGDHVGQQADVGVGEFDSRAACHSAGQLALEHPRQQQILIVRDAHLAMAEAFGDRCSRDHLVGRRVARGLAGALQRKRHGAVAAQLVGLHVAVAPTAVGLRCVGRRARRVPDCTHAVGQLESSSRRGRTRPAATGARGPPRRARECRRTRRSPRRRTSRPRPSRGS